ncbi:MAG: energy transducer TonB [Planctomycetota bacterium]|jgi:protein TonB
MGEGGTKNAILGLAGGVAATLALFLLIPLMNRSVYRRPEPRRGIRVRWMKLKKSRQPLKTDAKKTPPRTKPKALPPPKPPPPKPKFRRPPPPKTRIGAPGGRLRIDPGTLSGLAPGGVPLFLPEEPDDSEGKPPPVDAGTPEAREKTLYHPHEIDRPPRPLKRITPAYPSRARRRGIEGFAVLRFVVDARGRVRDVRITAWEGTETFGEAAERALLRWTFSPGRRGGKAVAVRCQLRFLFREED